MTLMDLGPQAHTRPPSAPTVVRLGYSSHAQVVGAIRETHTSQKAGAPRGRSSRRSLAHPIAILVRDVTEDSLNPLRTPGGVTIAMSASPPDDAPDGAPEGRSSNQSELVPKALAETFHLISDTDLGLVLAPPEPQQHLPLEVLTSIMQWLEGCVVCGVCSAVCRAWREAARDDNEQLWRSLVLARWGQHLERSGAGWAQFYRDQLLWYPTTGTGNRVPTGLTARSFCLVEVSPPLLTGASDDDQAESRPASAPALSATTEPTSLRVEAESQASPQVTHRQAVIFERLPRGAGQIQPGGGLAHVQQSVTRCVSRFSSVPTCQRVRALGMDRMYFHHLPCSSDTQTAKDKSELLVPRSSLNRRLPPPSLPPTPPSSAAALAPSAANAGHWPQLTGSLRPMLAQLVHSRRSASILCCGTHRSHKEATLDFGMTRNHMTPQKETAAAAAAGQYPGVVAQVLKAVFSELASSKAANAPTPGWETEVRCLLRGESVDVLRQATEEVEPEELEDEFEEEVVVDEEGFVLLRVSSAAAAMALCRRAIVGEEQRQQAIRRRRRQQLAERQQHDVAAEWGRQHAHVHAVAAQHHALNHYNRQQQQQLLQRRRQAQEETAAAVQQQQRGEVQAEVEEMKEGGDDCCRRSHQTITVLSLKIADVPVQGLYEYEYQFTGPQDEAEGEAAGYTHNRANAPEEEQEEQEEGAVRDGFAVPAGVEPSLAGWGDGTWPGQYAAARAAVARTQRRHQTATLELVEWCGRERHAPMSTNTPLDGTVFVQPRTTPSNYLRELVRSFSPAGHGSGMFAVGIGGVHNNDDSNGGLGQGQGGQYQGIAATRLRGEFDLGRPAAPLALKALERSLRLPSANHAFVACHTLASEEVDAVPAAGQRPQVVTDEPAAVTSPASAAAASLPPPPPPPSAEEDESGKQRPATQERRQRASLLDEVGVLVFTHEARLAFR